MSGADEHRQKLSRVLDRAVEDLLALTDEEVLAEVRETGGDADLLATEVAKEIAAAMSAAGRERLAAARAQLNGVRSLRNHPAIAKLSAAEKEQVLFRFAANDNPLQKRMTMAARSGNGLTEAEMDTILLDLIELGALDNEGRAR